MVTGSKWQMDAGGSSDTSLHIYQTTRHHVQGTAIFRTNFILPVETPKM
jgi:hypothetical protein